MPSNFSPATREEVREKTEEIPAVFETSECGQGIMAVYSSNENHTRCYTGLVENFGWYVSNYEPKENGDIVILMPITEVP